MIWVDWCILGLGLLSVVLGILRGFFREVATLAVWVLAFVVAMQFGQALAVSLDSYISVPSVRIAAAYAILFLGVLIAGAIVTHFVVEMIRRSVISGTDRALGGLFGIARALVIGGLLALLAGKTVVREDAWWRQSLLIPVLETVAQGLESVIPPAWIERLAPKPGTAPAEPTSAPAAAPANGPAGGT
jgi:membrane protein required for colicin V production